MKPSTSEDNEEVLVITARLKSGRFESSIQIPLMSSSKQEQDVFVESWLALMAAGIKCGSARKKDTK